MLYRPKSSPTNSQECVEACRRWSVGSITVALFGIVQGGMQIGQSATFAEAFNTARGAAYEIFQVIYRDVVKKASPRLRDPEPRVKIQQELFLA